MWQLETILSLSYMLVSLLMAISSYISAKNAEKYTRKLEAMTIDMSSLLALKARLTVLEEDVSDRIDNALRKMNQRRTMREKREQDEQEDLNNSKAGIIGYGPPKQHH